MAEVKITITAQDNASPAFRTVQASGKSALDGIKSEAQNSAAGMNKAFENLKILPTADLDAAKQRIAGSYEYIKNSGKASADEILRAERAKNQAISELNKQQLVEAKSTFDGILAHWKTVVGGFLAYKGVQFLEGTISAAEKLQNSLIGLAGQARYTGQDLGQSMQSATQLTSDGLLNVQASSQSLQNLLSRGFSLEESVQMLTRLKDAAAFNRQAHLSMSEAVVSATEGLKNENSILVDNGGVTKNVSIMWKEYAASIGKGADSLNQVEKRQAEYLGIMKETEGQVGNAKLATEGLTGAKARLANEIFKVKAALGDSLAPTFLIIGQGINWVLQNAIIPFIGGLEISATRMAMWASKGAAIWNWVTSGFKGGVSGIGGQFDDLNQQFDDQVNSIIKKWQGGVELPNIGKDSGKRRQDTILESAEVKKLGEEWGKTSRELGKEINTAGLNEFEKKLSDIEAKAVEYGIKYRDVATSQVDIENWKAAQIGKVWEEQKKEFGQMMQDMGIARQKAADEAALSSGNLFALPKGALAEVDVWFGRMAEKYRNNSDMITALASEAEARRFDVMRDWAIKRLEKEKETVGEQIKAAEELKNKYKEVYDEASKEAQKYFAIAKEAQASITQGNAFLAGLKPTVDPKQLAGQAWSDWNNILGQIQNAGAYGGPEKRLAELNALKSAMENYYNTYKEVKDSFGAPVVSSSFKDEYQGVLDHMTRVRDLAGDTGQAYQSAANEAKTAMEKQESAIEALKKKVVELDEAINQTRALTIDTTAASQAIDDLAAKVAGLGSQAVQIDGNVANSPGVQGPSPQQGVQSAIASISQQLASAVQTPIQTNEAGYLVVNLNRTLSALTNAAAAINAPSAMGPYATGGYSELIDEYLAMIERNRYLDGGLNEIGQMAYDAANRALDAWSSVIESEVSNAMSAYTPTGILVPANTPTASYTNIGNNIYPVSGDVLGSFAGGTAYVPKTGKYYLHEGEAVTPASQNVPRQNLFSFGNINITGVNDPVAIAKKIAKPIQAQLRRQSLIN